MGKKIFYIFLTTISLMTLGVLLFIQSQYFANILQVSIRKHLPADLGIDVNFQELSVKFMPPGVAILNPSLTLKENNAINLPAGTKIDARSIEVTLQVFQLMTGAININAFIIEGAFVKLEFDADYFEHIEKKEKSKSSSSFMPSFSWDKLVKFDFRSISLLDSSLEVVLNDYARKKSKIFLKTHAKEVTLGRVVLNKIPGYDIALDFGETQITMPEFRHVLSQLQMTAGIESQKLTIRNFGVQDESSGLSFHGVILGNLINPKALKSDLKYIFKSQFEKFAQTELWKFFTKLMDVEKKVLNFAGNLESAGSVKVDLLDFKDSIQIEFENTINLFSFRKWNFNKVLASGNFKESIFFVKEFKIETEGGSVGVDNIKFNTISKKHEGKTNVEFKGFDFRTIMGEYLIPVYPLHLKINGSIPIEFLLSGMDGPDPQFSIKGNGNLIVRDFSFDNQKFGITKPLNVLLDVPEVALKTNFIIDNAGFRFDQTEARLARTLLRASGSASGKHGIDIDVKGEIDLDDIKKLSFFPIRGAGNLHWTIKGKKPDILFTFDTVLKNASYLNLNLGDVKGRIVWDDGKDILSLSNLYALAGRMRFVANGWVEIAKTDEISIDVDIPSGTIQDFSVIFDNLIKKNIPWYPYELAGNFKGKVKVSGKTDVDELSVLGHVEVDNADYLGETFRSAKFFGGFKKGGYVAQNVQIQKKNGKLFGDMNVNSDGSVVFKLNTENLSTLDFDRFSVFQVPYIAPLEIKAEGVGKLETLKSDFQLNFGQGSVKNFTVERSSIHISTENRRLKAEVSAFGGAGIATLDYGFNKDSPGQFEAKASNLDYGPILVALNPTISTESNFEAQLSGESRIKFNTDSLSRLSGLIRLDSYRLRKEGFNLFLERPVSIDVNHGDYAFDSARFIGEGSELSISGKSRSGILDYKVNGNLNLGIIAFPMSSVESLHGAAQITAQITGKAVEPNFNGKVVVHDADIRLKSIEQPFEALKFNLFFDHSKVELRDFFAKLGGGEVRGSGSAEIFLTKVPRVDLNLFLDSPKIKFYPVAYARTNGKISLKGDSLPYSVKGNIAIQEALIRESFSLSEGSRAVRSSKFLPQKGVGVNAGEIHVFNLDVDLIADHGFWVKNDLLDVELKGALKVTNTPEVPKLLGAISVQQGKLFFKDNYFNIQSGNVRFNNPSTMDPEFDLTGQTEVKGYKVVLVASGRVSDYRLAFESQPALSQNDIVSLLTLGVTASGLQSLSKENRDAYSRDELYGLIFSQSGINKGLQEKLGVKVRVDQAQIGSPESVFRARGSELGQTISPKVVLQKQITKKLSASAGTTVGLGESRQQNFDLEYTLGKNVSVQGVYEDQSGAQLKNTRTSVGADLKFKLRFK